MTEHDERQALGRLFEEVPELYDRVRPRYPDELFADLAAITGADPQAAVLEIGCGTGQATASLVARGWDVTAVEPGAGLAALARRRLGPAGGRVETATFEDWDDRARRFDLLVAASSWHWIDPAVGWRRAHELLRPDGWMAVLGHVVVRRAGEVEVYAATADLHERAVPGNPGWGHPPTEDEVRATAGGWGSPGVDTGGRFGPPAVRWYEQVQWFDGAGFADLLRTTSLYRRIDPAVREPLLEAIADRIRSELSDRVPRRFLSVLRAARRT